MQSQGPGATKLSAPGQCLASLGQYYLTPLGGSWTVYKCQGLDGLTVFEGETCTLYLKLWAFQD